MGRERGLINFLPLKRWWEGGGGGLLDDLRYYFSSKRYPIYASIQTVFFFFSGLRGRWREYL